MSEQEWHQRFAEESFNRTWDLLDLTDRDQEQDAEMLAAAFAQRFHWFVVGDDTNKAVADWQVSRALAATDNGSLAVRFAEMALERASTTAGPDYLVPSCYEGLARAHAAAGDLTQRDACLEEARAGLASIVDANDRQLIASQIDEVG